MKIALILLVTLATLYSCESENQGIQRGQGTQLFKEPVSIPFDTIAGYTLHPVRGDSVKKNLEGVISGRKIKITGEVQLSDTIKKPYTMQGSFLPDKSESNNASIIPTEIVFSGSQTQFLARKKNGVLGNRIQVKQVVKTAIQKQSQISSPGRSADNDIVGLINFDIDQGLKSSYIWSLHEDRRGDIWITYDAGGMSCYDGNSFIHYGEAEGFTNTPVYSIMEDKSGNLWFTTETALIIRFDGKNFYHYTADNDLNPASIWFSLQDSKGNLWFATGENGVLFFDGTNVQVINENHGLSSNQVFSLLEDSDGNIWMGTNDGSATVYDGTHFKHFGFPEGLTSDCIYTMYEDDKGQIWFGTNKGVFIFDQKSFRNYNTEHGLLNDEIFAIRQDQHGTIWLATFGGGLTRFDGKTFSTLTTESGLNTDIITCLLEDDANNLWIGTNGGGVSYFNPSGIKLYTEKQGLAVNTIWSIIETSDQTMLFGGLNGAVNFLNDSIDSEIGTCLAPEEFFNDQIFCMLEDKNKCLWFGTYGDGLIHYNPVSKTYTNYTSESGLPADIILNIIEDKYGTIWVGTNGGGLTKMTKKNSEDNHYSQFTNYSSAQGFVGDIVISIKEDDEKNIWVGTYDGGAAKINLGKTDADSDDEFYFITEKEGLPSNTVLSIYEDHNNTIWFGTNGNGVSSFDGKTFINYRVENGLSNNQVWSILEDDENNLWMGTDNGITCFNPILNSQKEEEGYRLISFDKGDGLKGVDFVSNSAAFSKQSSVWFGTGKNLMRYDLTEFELPTSTPELRLETVLINENFYDFKSLIATDSIGFNFSSPSVFSNCPENLVLSHDHNHLTFYFRSIDWVAPYDLKFQYKLVGLDESWSQFTDEQKADYRNLSYGNYTLQVRAIGKAQNWSEQVNYSFTILPPWWHTWWARGLYLLAGIFLITLLIKWRTQTLKHRQKELEKTVALRTSELVEEKKQVEVQKERAEEQRELVQEKNKEILDSINYAKRIQTAILPPSRLLKEALKEHFIFYKPKDIVAGDFYWMQQFDELVLIAAADCTGHGVPGALVSVVCNGALNRAVREYGLIEPGQILDKTRELVIAEFEKSDSEVKDGMDISFCIINTKTHEIKWSGANNSLWIISNDELTEIKADKQPIGKYAIQKPFTTHTLQLKSNDLIYLFTDGYQDQFGGPSYKKFKASALKELLVEISAKTIAEQSKIVETTFEQWRNKIEQLDDVCIIGIRI